MAQLVRMNNSAQHCASCFVNIQPRPHYWREYKCTHCHTETLCDFCHVLIRSCWRCDNVLQLALIRQYDKCKLNVMHETLQAIPAELVEIMYTYSIDITSWYCGQRSEESNMECLGTTSTTDSQCGTDCGLAVYNLCGNQRPAIERAFGFRQPPSVTTVTLVQSSSTSIPKP